MAGKRGAIRTCRYRRPMAQNSAVAVLLCPDSDDLFICRVQSTVYLFPILDEEISIKAAGLFFTHHNAIVWRGCFYLKKPGEIKFRRQSFLEGHFYRGR